jgi:hypothetical protein
MSRGPHAEPLTTKVQPVRGRKGNGDSVEPASVLAGLQAPSGFVGKTKARDEGKATGKRKSRGEETEKSLGYPLTPLHDTKRHAGEPNGNPEGGLGKKGETRRALSSRPNPKKRGKKKQKFGSFTRRLWNDVEDEAIIELVSKYGIRKWTLISKKLQEEYHIYGRSGKQCRER